MQTKCYKEEKTDAELAKLQISLQLYDKETEHKMILRKQHRFLKEKEYEYKKFLRVRGLQLKTKMKKSSKNCLRVKDLDDDKKKIIFINMNPSLPKQDMAAKDTLGMDESETKKSKLEHTFYMLKVLSQSKN